MRLKAGLDVAQVGLHAGTAALHALRRPLVAWQVRWPLQLPASEARLHGWAVVTRSQKPPCASAQVAGAVGVHRWRVAPATSMALQV